MTSMKAAVFSCPGLGDGLVSMVISQNLYLNDYQVDTFHPKSFIELQNWFPHLPIKPFPLVKEIPLIISTYDQIFISYDEGSEFIMELISQGKNFEKKISKKKIFVLNPCPSKTVGRQPYFEDAKLSPDLSVVENFSSFCKNILLLPKTTKENGIRPPKNLIFQKEKKRIVIHPLSAKESKNWPITKYVKLAKILQKKKFYPCFVIHEKEREKLLFLEKENIPVHSFSSLENLAVFVYESGYMIGNDSGIGHLASCLQLPTISIFRNHRSAKLWHPDWKENRAVYPPSWILNISSFRIRDKYWKKWVSVTQVVKNFERFFD